MKPLHSQRIKQHQRILLISEKKQKEEGFGWVYGQRDYFEHLEEEERGAKMQEI